MAHSGLTTWGESLPIKELSDARAHGFDVAPSHEEMEALAQELDFSSLKKLKFSGELRPIGKRDWQLKGTLGATVVQPCVATLTPVTTRIDEPVELNFLSSLQYSDDEEVEMSEDVTSEPLPAEITLSDIAREALALAAPDYPRADGAELAVTQFTEPGQKAMSDEEAKPFAGLKALLGDDDSPQN